MIGKAITNILTSDAALTVLVGNKIYPIVIALDTALPAVVYAVDSIEPVYTKDGWAYDTCTFKVTSYAKDYAGVQDVAEAVRAALELKSGTFAGSTVSKIYMTGQEEYYQLDAEVYITRLSFTTKIDANG